MQLTDATYQGIYSGRWEVGFRPYEGVDFSRVCYMFSGQGSAAPGMFLSAYQQLEVVRRRFDEADGLAQSAGLPSPSLYLTDANAIPASALVVTRNLATYTAQVALCDHLLATRPPPLLLTGSSQGEYAALVCAGAIEFASLFEAIVARHRICGPANQLGFLVAVAASPPEIAAALGADCTHVSIRNSPVRSVIALAPDQRATVEDTLRRRGMGTKVLEVPHPYHSPLMGPAAQRFRMWVEARGLSLRPPRFTVLSSVTRTVITESIAAADLLSRQLTEPVDFPHQIEIAYARRCYAFLEVGPGATLGTFVRKILGAREHKSLDLGAYLPAAPARTRKTTRLDAWQAKVFGALRNAVAAMTGYEIESISLEDRFQEDLAIDSLKKVEILVHVVEEIDPGREDLGDLMEVQRLADVLPAFSRSPDLGSGPEPPSDEQIGRCSLVWEEAALATAGGRTPAEPRIIPLRALLDRAWRWSDDPRCTELVLVASPQDFASHAADAAPVQRDLERLLTLFQAFQSLVPRLEEHDFHLVLATSGDSHPFALGLAGFFKSLMQELPHFAFKHLHCAAWPSEAELMTLVEAERADRQNIDVRYEGRCRKVASLVPMEDVTLTEPVLADAVVVGFGGAKGITRALLEALARDGQPRLYLAGRSAREAVRDALEALLRLTPHVHYTALDAQDADAVNALLARVCREHGRVDVVINAVGVERSRQLGGKPVAEMREELNAKVLATMNILGAAAATSAGLVVNFGSLASRWGNAGQAVYACANEIVNQLTRAHNRSRGRLAAVAIEWPPWDGVGMTAHAAVLHQLRRRGLSLLRPQKGAALLAAELRHPRHDVVTYADQTDVRLLRAAMADRRTDRPLLGERTGEGRYQRVLDRTHDEWLRDHMINGVSYLPAASAITMALGFSRLANGGPGCLEEFHMVNPVALRDAPVALSLELEKVPAGIGVRGRTSLVHFRCRVHDELALYAPAPTALEAGRLLDAGQLYREGWLFHGPTFQVLHQVLVSGTSRFEGRIDSARLRAVYGMEQWDRLTQWLDGAFQLLGLAALLKEGALALPVAIRRLSIPGPWGHPSFVTLALHDVRIAANEVTGDVVLAAEGRQPILHLEEVRLRVLPSVVQLDRAN